METIIVVWLSLMIVLLLFSLFLLVRIKWAHRARMGELNKEPASVGLREYYRLPSYNAMIWRFWVWDVEKFKAKGT